MVAAPPIVSVAAATVAVPALITPAAAASYLSGTVLPTHAAMDAAPLAATIFLTYEATISQENGNTAPWMDCYCRCDDMADLFGVAVVEFSGQFIMLSSDCYVNCRHWFFFAAVAT